LGPIAHKWALLSYEQWTPLFLNGSFLAHCQSGGQQGDPMMPFVFSLVFRSLSEKMNDIASLAVRMFYLDDGTYAGSPEAISAVFQLLVSEGPSVYSSMLPSVNSSSPRMCPRPNGLPWRREASFLTRSR
jgi:hypothetical protein